MCLVDDVTSHVTGHVTSHELFMYYYLRSTLGCTLEWVLILTARISELAVSMVARREFQS